jgi:hypothetical protein
MKRQRTCVLRLVLVLVGVYGAGAFAGASQTTQTPNQFPPRGTGLTPAEAAALQAAVDDLEARVLDLKTKYRTGSLADRVADVEVYLDAVRRPLKYDERLWAGRGSTKLLALHLKGAMEFERAASSRIAKLEAELNSLRPKV